MKRTTLLLMLGALLILPLSGAAQGPTLVLHKSDGSTQEVELYTMPHIHLTADKMLVKSAVLNLEFPKSDVVRFTYKNVATGVNTVSPSAAFRIDSDRITFRSIPEAGAVKVYNVKGEQQSVSFNIVGGDAVLLLSQLPKGVYLVTFNGKTFKIVRP
jgi:hypothetical protein